MTDSATWWAARRAQQAQQPAGPLGTVQPMPMPPGLFAPPQAPPQPQPYPAPPTHPGQWPQAYAPPQPPYGYQQPAQPPAAPYPGVPLTPAGVPGYGAPAQAYADPAQVQMVPVYDPSGRVLGFQPVMGGVPVPVPGMPAPGMPPNQQWQPAPNPNDQLPYMQAIAHWTAQYQQKAPDIGACPECGSPDFMVRAEGNRVMNTTTGMMNDPAPECWNCGYAGPNRPNVQTGSLHGSLSSGVKVVGSPKMARGAGTAEQVQQQAGMINLYAAKR